MNRFNRCTCLSEMSNPSLATFDEMQIACIVTVITSMSYRRPYRHHQIVRIVTILTDILAIPLTSGPRQSSPHCREPHGGLRGFCAGFGRISERYVTKCAPHTALNLIARCMSTFDDRVVAHVVIAGDGICNVYGNRLDGPISGGTDSQR